jgi:two-component system KDP operon response regulator KdpE/two-component system response regulator VicR
MKILIAENDCETIDKINMVFNLCQPDWSLSTTASGKECLDIIENGNGNSPDAVIMGTDLTDMSGFDLIEHIRLFSDIPLILLSNRDDGTATLKAFTLGADAYMTKPFNQLELVARIRALFRRRYGLWNIKPKERKKRGRKIPASA